jgi:hemerythrin-like domain-containing protein
MEQVYSKSLKILVDEHKNILKVVEILEKESFLLESSKKINEKKFQEIIEFIINYADKFHHAKEEDILFKKLAKCIEEQNVHCNPVKQMLYEHNKGRNFVKMMKDGISGKNNKQVIEGARGYISLIREHIFKEDSILYPLAEEVISVEEKIKMAEKFEKIKPKKLAIIN